MTEYIEKAFNNVQPIWAVFLSVIMYVVFPENSYLAAFCAVMAMCVIDILTKYYAISSKNGGFINSVKIGKIKSKTLWKGTSRKLMDYFIIFIMVGLSYRVAPIATAIVLIGNTVYSFIFFRECQSVLENLDDAGHDVEWALKIIKRRKEKVLENEGIETEAKKTDHESRV